MPKLNQRLSLSLTPEQATVPGVFSGADAPEATVPDIVNYCRFSKCQQAQVLFTSTSHRDFEELERLAEAYLWCINILLIPGEMFTYTRSQGPELLSGVAEHVRWRYLHVTITRSFEK